MRFASQADFGMRLTFCGWTFSVLGKAQLCGVAFDLFDFALTDNEMAQLSAPDKKEPFIGKPETPELVEFSLTW